MLSGVVKDRICTHPALPNLRLVTILENFEVIYKRANLEGSSITLLNVRKIEQDILYATRAVGILRVEAWLRVLPLIEAFRNHAL